MTTTQRPYNILRNGSFEVWSSGTSSAPDSWTKGGTGTIARSTQAADPIYGSYCAVLKTDAQGAETTLWQGGIEALELLNQNGDTVTFGAWIKADTGTRARLYIYDASSTYYSDWATGTSQFLTVSHTWGSLPSTLQVGLKIETEAGQVEAFIDGAVCVVGSEAYGFMPNALDKGGEVYEDLTFKGSKTVKGLPASGGAGQAVRHEQIKTAANSVSGKTLYELADTPSAAGALPTANLPGIWEKVYETELASAQTSITISTWDNGDSVDGNSDEVYQIIVVFKNGVNGAGSIDLRPNNASGAVYDHENVYGAGTGIYAYEYTNQSSLRICATGAIGEWCFTEAILQAKLLVGQYRSMMTREYRVNLNDIYFEFGRWRNTADNITSLVFVGSAASAMAIGTQITIFRKSK